MQPVCNTMLTLLNFVGLYCLTLVFLRPNLYRSLRKHGSFSVIRHSFGFRKVRCCMLNKYIYAKTLKLSLQVFLTFLRPSECLISQELPHFFKLRC